MLMSPVKRFEELRFIAMPAYAKSVDRAVQVNGYMLVLFKDGLLHYSGGAKLHAYAYVPGMYGWITGLTKGLLKLKVVTKDEAKEHLDWCLRCSELDTRRYDRERMIELAKRYKFRLTDDQRKKMRFDVEDRP